MSTRGIEVLMSRGYLTHDSEEIYVGDPEVRVQSRIYYVQLSGEMNAKSYWTEPTIFSPQKYLRDVLREYPDAMILKTKFM